MRLTAKFPTMAHKTCKILPPKLICLSYILLTLLILSLSPTGLCLICLLSKERGPRRNQSWWHLILDFQAQNCEKIDFSCLSHPAFCYSGSSEWIQRIKKNILPNLDHHWEWKRALLIMTGTTGINCDFPGTVGGVFGVLPLIPSLLKWSVLNLLTWLLPAGLDQIVHSLKGKYFCVFTARYLNVLHTVASP